MLLGKLSTLKPSGERSYYVTFCKGWDPVSIVRVTKPWYETRHRMERRLSRDAGSMGGYWRYATKEERDSLHVRESLMEKYLHG